MSQTKLLICNVCGCKQEGAAADWFALHFGVRAPHVLVEPNEADPYRLGEKHACSRECLVKLVLDWAESWRAKQEKRACALTN